MRTTITLENRIVMTLQVDFDVSDAILFRSYMSGLLEIMHKQLAPNINLYDGEWRSQVLGSSAWVKIHPFDVVDHAQSYLQRGFRVAHIFNGRRIEAHIANQ